MDSFSSLLFGTQANYLFTFFMTRFEEFMTLWYFWNIYTRSSEQVCAEDLRVSCPVSLAEEGGSRMYGISFVLRVACGRWIFPQCTLWTDVMQKQNKLEK